jgi:hypothetical protein
MNFSGPIVDTGSMIILKVDAILKKLRDVPGRVASAPASCSARCPPLLFPFQPSMIPLTAIPLTISMLFSFPRLRVSAVKNHVPPPHYPSFTHLRRINPHKK